MSLELKFIEVVWDIIREEWEASQQQRAARRQWAYEENQRLKAAEEMRRAELASLGAQLGITATPQLFIAPQMVARKDRATWAMVGAQFTEEESREKWSRLGARVRPARVGFEYKVIGGTAGYNVSTRDTADLLKYLEALRLRRTRSKRLGALIDAISDALAEAQNVYIDHQRVTVDVRAPELILEALTRKKLPETSDLRGMREQLRELLKAA